MKAFAIALLLLLSTFAVQAQFGVNAKYLIPSDDTWSYNTQNGQGIINTPYLQGWSAGVDYWFRLKNKRVEFLPEVNVAQLSNSDPDFDNRTDIYSFFFNTNLYLWDFTGDCDCPTFSKQGPTLAKGLFLQLSPGVSYWKADISDDSAEIQDGALAFSIAGGIGFDLGITDLITVTPIANLRYFPKFQLEGNLINQEDPPTQELITFSSSESPLIWSAGIRLGFRLDSKRY